MKNPTKPYYAVDKTIYFTDRVEEVLIYSFDKDDTADTICELLNSAYDSAYNDGLNASLNRHYKELLDKLFSLKMENSRLKSLMKMNE